MNNIFNFKDYCFENNQKQSYSIIAYHGSPYKFKKPKAGLKKHLQLGADMAIWFTPQKEVAKRFALQRTTKESENILEMEKYYNKQKEKELKKWIEKQNLLQFLQDIKHEFSKYDDFNLDNEKLEKIFKNKDIESILKFLEFLTFHFGKRNLPDRINQYMKEYFQIEKKYENIIKEKEKEIKRKQLKKPGYIYKAKINLGDYKVIQGQDIGITWDRYDELLSASEEYDSIYIENADTGMGITDEIAVFDPSKIEILEVEKIYP